MFQPYRKFANPLTGGVEDRVADCRVGSDIGEFAQSFDTRRIDMVSGARLRTLLF
jgi:hypothetical protein